MAPEMFPNMFFPEKGPTCKMGWKCRYAYGDNELALSTSIIDVLGGVRARACILWPLFVVFARGARAPSLMTHRSGFQVAVYSVTPPPCVVWIGSQVSSVYEASIRRTMRRPPLRIHHR